MSVFGACSTNETKPYVFHHPDGFGHQIHKSPEFLITDNRKAACGLIWVRFYEAAQRLCMPLLRHFHGVIDPNTRYRKYSQDLYDRTAVDPPRNNGWKNELVG